MVEGLSRWRFFRLAETKWRERGASPHTARRIALVSVLAGFLVPLLSVPAGLDIALTSPDAMQRPVLMGWLIVLLGLVSLPALYLSAWLVDSPRRLKAAALAITLVALAVVGVFRRADIGIAACLTGLLALVGVSLYARSRCRSSGQRGADGAEGSTG